MTSYRTLTADRTWRLPLRVRLLYLTLVPVFLLAIGSILAPSGSSSADTAALYLMGGLFLAYLVLVWRVWRMSVTLTTGTLVIRNAFTTRRVPVANITRVLFDRNRLLVIEAGTALPTGGNVGTGPARPYSPSARRTVLAVPVGAAYWTGRRTEADEVANMIAAAAGLSLPSPRKPKYSRGLVHFMLVASLVLMIIGAVLLFMHGTTVSGSPNVSPTAADIVRASAGAGCLAVGFLSLFRSALAAIDYRRAPRPTTSANSPANDA